MRVSNPTKMGSKYLTLIENNDESKFYELYFRTKVIDDSKNLLIRALELNRRESIDIISLYMCNTLGISRKETLLSLPEHLQMNYVIATGVIVSDDHILSLVSYKKYEYAHACARKKRILLLELLINNDRIDLARQMMLDKVDENISKIYLCILIGLRKQNYDLVSFCLFYASDQQIDFVLRSLIESHDDIGIDIILESHPNLEENVIEHVEENKINELLSRYNYEKYKEKFKDPMSIIKSCRIHKIFEETLIKTHWTTDQIIELCEQSVSYPPLIYFMSTCVKLTDCEFLLLFSKSLNHPKYFSLLLTSHPNTDNDKIMIVARNAKYELLNQLSLSTLSQSNILTFVEIVPIKILKKYINSFPNITFVISKLIEKNEDIRLTSFLIEKGKYDIESIGHLIFKYERIELIESISKRTNEIMLVKFYYGALISNNGKMRETFKTVNLKNLINNTRVIELSLIWKDDLISFVESTVKLESIDLLTWIFESNNITLIKKNAKKFEIDSKLIEEQIKLDNSLICSYFFLECISKNISHYFEVAKKAKATECLSKMIKQ